MVDISSYNSLLVLAFIFVIYKPLVESCACLPNHPQKAFCDAAFVIRAKITSKPIIKIEKNIQDFYTFEIRHAYYKIDIIDIFKGHRKVSNTQPKPETYPDKEHTYIHTYADQNICGTNFDYGSEYLITGSMISHQLHVNNCHWKVVWDRMSREMKDGVIGGYGCDCTVVMCIGAKFCYYSSNRPACKMSTTWTQAVNKRMMRHCTCRTSNKDGSCEWTSNGDDYC